MEHLEVVLVACVMGHTELVLEAVRHAHVLIGLEVLLGPLLLHVGLQLLRKIVLIEV